ncbi:MAG: hypothetical protein V7K65_03180, partial [Nostoc sp.]
ANVWLYIVNASACNANVWLYIVNASACNANVSVYIVNVSACNANVSVYIVNVSVCINNATLLRKAVLSTECIVFFFTFDQKYAENPKMQFSKPKKF